MHSLLYKLLGKRGIKSIDQLTPEERVDFDNWNAVLSKDNLTIDDIREFCRNQCEIIKQKWADYNISQNTKSELIPYFTVYNTLLTAIDSPKIAREALEKQLTELTKN